MYSGFLISKSTHFFSPVSLSMNCISPDSGHDGLYLITYFLCRKYVNLLHLSHRGGMNSSMDGIDDEGHFQMIGIMWKKTRYVELY
jgi:hypothetical protein